MWVCSKCGNSLEDSRLYCPNCGNAKAGVMYPPVPLGKPVFSPIIYTSSAASTLNTFGNISAIFFYVTAFLLFIVSILCFSLETYDLEIFQIAFGCVFLLLTAVFVMLALLSKALLSSLAINTEDHYRNLLNSNK